MARTLLSFIWSWSLLIDVCRKMAKDGQTRDLCDSMLAGARDGHLLHKHAGSLLNRSWVWLTVHSAHQQSADGVIARYNVVSLELNHR